jgi:3-deoxy-7-phosphoheptulonate synthase
MHGNTFKNDQGIKTRHFNTILKELELYMSIHKSSNSFPGGIHIEFTSENVTECLGGFQNIDNSTLMNRYETACDPRLNNQQSLELIFKLNDLMNEENYDV